jgi:hypothetical protein
VDSPDTLPLKKGVPVAVAPTSTRDFLIKVGLISCLIVPTLSLLNLFFPSSEKLICKNPEVHATGSAARGRGTTVTAQVRTPSGELLYDKMFTTDEFTCTGVFGEGWTNVR